jgi:tetratricopeptide (TPR) repeat protein
MRAVHAVALGDAAQQAELETDLGAARDLAVHWAVRAVASYLGDFEAALRLSRALIDPLRAPETRALGHVLRAHLELARGRWRAAQAELAAAETFDRDQATACTGLLTAAPTLRAPADRLLDARAAIAAWSPANPSPAAASISRLLPRPDLYAQQRLYLMGLLDLRLGDFEAALVQAAALESTPCAPDAVTLVRETAAAIRARVAWSLGRRDEALAEILQARRPVRFDLLHPSPFHAQADERFALAGWLEESGRHEEALPWYASFLRGSVHDLVYAAPALLREGAIYERLREIPCARERYGRFAAAWRDCDPELRPLLEEARAGIERLEPR